MRKKVKPKVVKKAIKDKGRRRPPKIKSVVKPKKERVLDNKKYIRVPATESEARFKEIGEMVGRKELKWVYFGLENGVGIHFYLKLNTFKK